MNAFQIPGMRWSLPSGVAIPWHRFVSVNAEGNAILATASTPVIGTSQNETKVGEVQEIIDGIVMVEASAAIAAGDKVASDAEGKAVKATTDYIGIAITSATAAGMLVTVKM